MSAALDDGVSVDSLPVSFTPNLKPLPCRSRPPFPWETPGPKPILTSSDSCDISSSRALTIDTPWTDPLTQLWIDVSIKPYERDLGHKIPMDRTLFPSSTVDAVRLVSERMVELECMVGGGKDIVRRVVVRPVVWAVRWAVDVAWPTAPRSASNAGPKSVGHVGDDESLRTVAVSEKNVKRRIRCGSEVSASTLTDSPPKSKSSRHITTPDYVALLGILTTLQTVTQSLIVRLDLRLDHDRYTGEIDVYRSTAYLVTEWEEGSRATVQSFAHIFVFLGLAKTLLKTGGIARYETTTLGINLSSIRAILDGLVCPQPPSSPSPPSYSASFRSGRTTLIGSKHEKESSGSHEKAAVASGVSESTLPDIGDTKDALRRLEWTMRVFALREKSSEEQKRKNYERYSL